MKWNGNRPISTRRQKTVTDCLYQPSGAPCLGSGPINKKNPQRPPHSYRTSPNFPNRTRAYERSPPPYEYCSGVGSGHTCGDGTVAAEVRPIERRTLSATLSAAGTETTVWLSVATRLSSSARRAFTGSNRRPTFVSIASSFRVNPTKSYAYNTSHIPHRAVR